MSTIVLRATKGSPLTNTEVDNNFSNISTAIATGLTAASYTAADVLSKVNSLTGPTQAGGLNADTMTFASGARSATNANTASAIVARDSSGNFSAGTITADLSGNATNFTGLLIGNVTGTQGNTVVASVGGSTASNINTATIAANAATSATSAATSATSESAADAAACTTRLFRQSARPTRPAARQRHWRHLRPVRTGEHDRRRCGSIGPLAAISDGPDAAAGVRDHAVDDDVHHGAVRRRPAGLLDHQQLPVDGAAMVALSQAPGARSGSAGEVNLPRKSRSC